MNKVDKINLKEFPSTRYQGSKRKIIPWIFEKIKDLEFETCLDAFGGTGSVSYLFKKMGKKVTYNDILKFNFLIGKAIIENKNVKLTDKDIYNLKSNNSENNFIQKYFKDVYYHNEENKWLDNITGNILNMNHYTWTGLEYKKAISYYVLFQSCLIKRPFNLFHRKNLNIRSRNVKRNFGNKTSWDKTFNYYFEKFAKEANNLIFDNGKECNTLNKTVFEIDEKYDLVYLDPPYLNRNGSNETANYLRCYHFLEGISNYNIWKELIDENSINLRFKNCNMTDFKMDIIYDTFNKLLMKFRKSIIVLSYKKGGIPSVDFLVTTLKKVKKSVKTYSLHYNYALNHQNGEATKNREVLIIGY